MARLSYVCEFKDPAIECRLRSRHSRLFTPLRYESRKEAGAPTINIRVAPQMRKEVYDGITKGTKWVAGGGKAKGGKKKSGKKGKKKK